MKIPAKLYRVTKTADGEGGYTETYDYTYTLIWVSLVLHETTMMMVVDSNVRIQVGDVVEILEAEEP